MVYCSWVRYICLRDMRRSGEIEIELEEVHNNGGGK